MQDNSNISIFWLFQHDSSSISSHLYHLLSYNTDSDIHLQTTFTSLHMELARRWRNYPDPVYQRLAEVQQYTILCLEGNKTVWKRLCRFLSAKQVSCEQFSVGIYDTVITIFGTILKLKFGIEATWILTCF
jgi:hypothetical protein